MARLLLVSRLICWLAVGRGVMADLNPRQASETTEACPRCDMIFTMLETDSSGERVQHIEMVERGEDVFYGGRDTSTRSFHLALNLKKVLVHKLSQYVAPSNGVFRMITYLVQKRNTNYCAKGPSAQAFAVLASFPVILASTVER